MTQTTSSAEIQSLVSDFTQQLTLLIRRSALEHVLATLGDGGLPAGKRAARPAARPVSTATVAAAAAAPAPGARRIAKAPKGGRRDRASVTAMGQTLLDFVKQSPGQRGEQIAAALKTDVNTMRLPMRKLIDEKKVRTKGQRRGMTYFPA